MNRQSSGFTLIEVMIVVGIIAILSAVAVPGYQEYVMRGRLQEAHAGLSAKQVQLEQWFLDRRTYVGAPACVNDTRGSHFDFNCNGTETAAGYVLSAAGKGSMTGFSFTIDQNSARTTGAVAPGWTLPAPNNCWTLRKSGTCS